MLAPAVGDVQVFSYGSREAAIKQPAERDGC
jgi:hypothetical protein